MSAVASTPRSIRVQAIDASHAGSLVQALVRVFEAEDVSIDQEHMEVVVQARGDSNRAVVSILDAVEEWLAADGLPATTVQLNGRAYRVAAREGGAQR